MCYLSLILLLILNYYNVMTCEPVQTVLSTDNNNTSSNSSNTPHQSTSVYDYFSL